MRNHKGEKLYALGIDLGTTSICIMVINVETKDIIELITRKNDRFLKSENSWERIQDAEGITNDISMIIDELSLKYNNIVSIGISCQMHGIVYVDDIGLAISPLFTWQDGRGDLLIDRNETYAQYLSKKSGYNLATGYGSVTHFYNTYNNLVPSSAKYFCTIGDYLAMRLVRRTNPIIHSSNAASLGMFDLDYMDFDKQAIEKSGMNTDMFPAVLKWVEVIGTTKSNIPVTVAIGDNQASFNGSVSSPFGSILLNIGTGSQISLYVEHLSKSNRKYARPFIDGGFLLVGSPLCGGRAYALLEEFFREVILLATGDKRENLYDMMAKIMKDYPNIENKLNICTEFSGRRDDPLMRGSIDNIGTNNFTPQHFILGVLEGIANELYDLYEEITGDANLKILMLIGSGNGIRKNERLQRIISDKFHLPLSLPNCMETAALGAALLSIAILEENGHE